MRQAPGPEIGAMRRVRPADLARFDRIEIAGRETAQGTFVCQRAAAGIYTTDCTGNR